MTAKFLYGDTIVYHIKEEVKKQVEELKAQEGVDPCLAVCLVGEDPASAIYVRNKETMCREVGIKSVRTNLATTTTEELVKIVKRWNADSSVHGILVQLPLPPQVDRFAVFDAMSPDKDVDGFHPTTIGKLCQNRPCLAPCTPAGIIEIFKHYKIETKGKRVVIVNRSLVVGEPLSLLLASEGPYGNATVTICHEHTQKIKRICRSADILITAVGRRPNFVLRTNMVKKDAVVIDVGISRIDGRILGDAEEGIKERASAVTPVPGGVGPVTVAMLMKNTITAARMQLGVIDAI